MTVERLPTLFDRIYAATFAKRPSRDIAIMPSVQLRRAVFSARRFTLDDAMSSFLADLSYASFERKSDLIQNRIAETMRQSARLPHRQCWIEYNFKATVRRIDQLRGEGGQIPIPFGGDVDNRDHLAEKEGWLLEQDPQIETAFKATIFWTHEEFLSTFTRYYCWASDETALPFPTFELMENGNRYPTASLALGLRRYRSQQIGLNKNPHSPQPELATNPIILFNEYGILRRIWALLATINDLPVLVINVAPNRGFFVHGNYRKFLDYKILTLKVPQAEYHPIARKIVAKVRRRAHMVRGHFRKDYHHPGERIWIKEHQRGDVSLGFVVHDYKVIRAEDAS